MGTGGGGAVPVITVDDRTGSKELAEPLRTLGGIVKVARLPYADVAFTGEGPEECPWPMVGVELKTIDDLLSCIETRRFSDHQLPGLLSHYNVVYLVVEGVWGPAPSGVLQIEKHKRMVVPASGRGWMYSAVSNYLLQLEAQVGVRVHRTLNRAETCHHLLATAKSWGHDWAGHESFLPTAGVDLFCGAVAFRKPTLLWEVAMRLPGVGRKALTGKGKRRSTRVDQVFGSVRDMVGYKGTERWEKVGLSKAKVEELQRGLDAPGGWR